MKRIIILLIVIVPTFYSYAGKIDFREHTKKWLQRGNSEDSEETSGGLRGAIKPGEEPPSNPTVPVGMLPVVGLSLFGGLYAVNRKKRQTSNN